MNKKLNCHFKDNLGNDFFFEIEGAREDLEMEEVEAFMKRLRDRKILQPNAEDPSVYLEEICGAYFED